MVTLPAVTLPSISEDDELVDSDADAEDCEKEEEELDDNRNETSPLSPLDSIQSSNCPLPPSFQRSRRSAVNLPTSLPPLKREPLSGIPGDLG